MTDSKIHVYLIDVVTRAIAEERDTLMSRAPMLGRVESLLG